MLYAIVGVIAKPTATFRAISNDPNRYTASSAAIFATVCLVSALPLTNVWSGSDSGIFNGFDNAVLAYAKSLIHPVLSNFLIIAIVFWVGSRYGGNRKFKNVFPVLSYCLIPVTLGGVVTVTGTHLFVDLLVFPHGHGSGMSIELLPNFAFHFAGDATIFLVRYSFSVIFFGMGFRVIRKGNKDIARVRNRQSSWCFSTGGSYRICTRNFCRTPSIRNRVLALAAVTTYALTIALGILKGLFLPPAWL